MAQKKNKKKVTLKKQGATSGVAFRPVGDRVLIRELKALDHEKSPSGIFVPVSEKDSGAKRGTVVAVGRGKTEAGALVPLSVEVGETVLFQWGEQIELDGKEYFLVREGEILGILA